MTFSRLLLRAAVDLVNLVVLVCATLLAIELAAPAVWVAGLAVYLFLVGARACSPRFARAVQAHDEARTRELPEPEQLAQQSLQLVTQQLRRAFARTRWQLSLTPAGTKAPVSGAIVALEELRGRAALLIRECDLLQRHLASIKQDDIHVETTRLLSSLKDASAPAKASYEEALTLRAEQLGALEKIEMEQDRRFASLKAILSAVEAFPSWVVELGLLEKQARCDVVGEASEQLARLRGEFGSARQLLEGLAPTAAPLETADGLDVAT